MLYVSSQQQHPEHIQQSSICCFVISVPSFWSWNIAEQLSCFFLVKAIIVDAEVADVLLLLFATTTSDVVIAETTV